MSLAGDRSPWGKAAWATGAPPAAVATEAAASAEAGVAGRRREEAHSLAEICEGVGGGLRGGPCWCKSTRPAGPPQRPAGTWRASGAGVAQ